MSRELDLDFYGICMRADDGTYIQKWYSAVKDLREPFDVVKIHVSDIRRYCAQITGQTACHIRARVPEFIGIDVQNPIQMVRFRHQDCVEYRERLFEHELVAVRKQTRMSGMKIGAR